MQLRTHLRESRPCPALGQRVGDFLADSPAWGLQPGSQCGNSKVVDSFGSIPPYF